MCILGSQRLFKHTRKIYHYLHITVIHVGAEIDTICIINIIYIYIYIYVEGVTLVLPSRPFMFNEYWRILALS